MSLPITRGKKLLSPERIGKLGLVMDASSLNVTDIPLLRAKASEGFLCLRLGNTSVLTIRGELVLGSKDVTVAGKQLVADSWEWHGPPFVFAVAWSPFPEGKLVNEWKRATT